MLSAEMSAIIVAVVTPILSAITGYVTFMIKNKKQGETLETKAMIILLRRELREQYQTLTSKQSITIEELEEFDEVYEIYHELGGNGTGTKMHDFVHQMKVKG